MSPFATATSIAAPLGNQSGLLVVEAADILELSILDANSGTLPIASNEMFPAAISTTKKNHHLLCLAY
jgi:hypothetical protein